MRTFAASFLLVAVASPLAAGGSLRLANSRIVPGAGDVAVADFFDFAGRTSNVVLTLGFNSSTIVSHRVGAGSFLIDGVTSSSPDGPRQLAVVPPIGPGAIDDVRSIVVSSGGNEVAEYGTSTGGAVNLVMKVPGGGTEPFDVAITRNGRFAVTANRGSDDVRSFRLDPATGLLTPVAVQPVGDAPDLLAVDQEFIAAANSGSSSVSILRIDPTTGLLAPVGAISLGRRVTGLALRNELNLSNSFGASSSPSEQSVAARGELLYVGLRSNQAGAGDEIQTYRVGAGGELTLAGSTPAGLFLTDFEVTYDRLYAVTASTNQLDEVRVYRRSGTQLILDASLEMPGSPSFKQIAVAPTNGRVTALFVTGFQGGWLRSIEYTRDTDAVCVPSAEALCANGGRFEVSVDWQVESQGLSGIGIAAPISSDTGYFWFFSANNVELVIKVLDGRAFNDSYWVFYGALSDVAYAITVRDTRTGRVRRYENPQGRLASVADTSAFPGGGSATAPGNEVDPEVVRVKSAELANLLARAPRPSAVAAFQVRIDWRVPSQGTSGAGHGVILTPDTAYFWFFSANNVEVVIKVVDGRAFNGHFWVFYGALSDVEYTITVTDTVSGAQKVYFNPSGDLASVADTAAF